MEYAFKGESDLGGYHFLANEIRLNLRVIKECCDEYNTDFYTLLMHVINHEFLHYILYIEQDKDISNALDNLTHCCQTDENIWKYWLA